MSDPPVNYLICSNPRSGTTLLCDMLTQTGVAGRPNSFFRQKSLAEWCAHWEIDGPGSPEDRDFRDRYFNALWAEGQGGTPVFGMRVMGPDLPVALRWLALRHPDVAGEQGRFVAEFGPVRFIHLSRRDKVAEAVSYLRAEQTGLWHGRPDGSTMEYMPPSRVDAYDESAIAERVSELTALDKTWVNWFKAQQITPLSLTYEALADDPNRVLARVLGFIGQDPADADHITPGVRKLADDTSAEWIARFKAARPSG